MAYPVNSKINPYNQQQQMTMGMNSDSVGNNGVAMGLNTPQLQDVNVDKVVEKSALKGIKDDDDALFSFKTFLISLPITAAMIYGMDKFNAACGGDYDKSLVGKINKYGEKVGEKVPALDTAVKKVETFVNWFKTKVASKTSITSSFFNNPSMPESPTVSMMALGTHAEIATEAISKVKQYVDQGGVIKGSATAEEIAKLADHNTKRDLKYVNRIMEICREQGDAVLKVNKFGNVKNIWLVGRLFKKDRYFSDLLPKSWHETVSRKIHLSEFANKIQAIVKPNAKTAVGQRLSKLTLRIVEGLTNGTAGGKVAVFMGAYFIADAIKKAIHAPHKKGEKRKVFAENMISNVGMYMTMPISIILMHKFGGLQYLGMGKGEKQTENLAKYRKLLGELNEAAEKGTIDKATYKAKVKELKEIRVSALKLLKTDSAPQKALKVVKNIVYRPIMRFFNILAVGLERIKPYKNTSNSSLITKSLNGFKTGWDKFKGGAGYPVRMGIFMFMIAPFFDKILAKGSHLFFGRPMKSRLDEGKEQPEESTNRHPQPVVRQGQERISTPPSVMMPSKNQANRQIKPFERQNLLDMYKAQHAPQRMMPASQENAGMQYSQAQQMIPAAQNYNMYAASASAPAMIPTDDEQQKRRYIPSSAPVKISNSEPARSYIPSAAGVVINPNIEFQESLKAQDAFLKAERAELRAKGHVD